MDKMELGKLEERNEIEIEEEKHDYVYGIINNKEINLDLNGLRDKPIKKVDFGDISVLTSPYPLLNPMLKEEEAIQHAEILKKIAEKTTVIPMAFGTVFKDEEILKEVLSKSYPIVKRTLGLIKNKIELGIKVVKNNLDDVPDEVTKEILDSLNRLSVKGIKGENFSERLLLNHSFLVEKDNFTKFSDKIAELESKYQDLKFIYTGPWPPYSFVNIQIKGG